MNYRAIKKLIQICIDSALYNTRQTFDARLIRADVLCALNELDTVFALCDTDVLQRVLSELRCAYTDAYTDIDMTYKYALDVFSAFILND